MYIDDKSGYLIKYKTSNGEGQEVHEFIFQDRTNFDISHLKMEPKPLVYESDEAQKIKIVYEHFKVQSYEIIQDEKNRVPAHNNCVYIGIGENNICSMSIQK